MNRKLFFVSAVLFFACSNNDSGNNGDDLSSSSSSLSKSSSSSAYGGSATSSSDGASAVSSSNTDPSVSSSSFAPPVAGNWPKLQKGGDGVFEGWGSRYWDGCKPHCSLPDNVDKNAVPYTICRNCDINNNEIPTFTLSPNIEIRYDEWEKVIKEDWIGYEETKSSCQNNGIAYTCFDMAPIALSETLSYGFGAVSGENAACGKCFQLQFDGGNHGDDVKEAHRLLKDKTMIILASNIGHDVSAGSNQIDILVPGGGLGIFDGFSNQIGVSASDLGNQSGGLLRDCQDGKYAQGWDAPAAKHQECIRERCQDIFGKNEKHKDLLNGCLWFADWFMAADNPTFLVKEVECPDYLTQKYSSTINTEPNTKIAPYGGFNKNIPDGYETVPWTW
jgi:hypothetical protein